VLPGSQRAGLRIKIWAFRTERESDCVIVRKRPIVVRLGRP
jgi:hypothetical protein